MTVEHEATPPSHEGIPHSEDPETTRPVVLWGLVEDLFTCEQIAQTMQQVEVDDEVQAFIWQWKSEWVQQLEATIETAVRKFQTDFAHFQAESAEAPSPTPSPDDAKPSLPE